MSDYVIEKAFLFMNGSMKTEVILETIDALMKIKQGKAHELSESDGNLFIYTKLKELGKGEIFECSLSVTRS